MTSLAISNYLECSDGRTIFRADHSKENPYTVLSNKLLRDPNIKRSDKGLLAELLSWGDKHRICIQALAKKGKEGRDAISGMLKRLEEAGYIKRIQLKNNDGTFAKVVYQIFESPLSTKVLAEAESNQQDSADEVEDINQLAFNFDGEESSIFEEADNGFSVNGKGNTNKYNNKRSKIFNNSNKVESENASQVELLKRFQLNINNPILHNRLTVSSLNQLIATQLDLDRFLIDFNQQHEKYAHLNDVQRLNNFIAYLCRIKVSPAEYKKHLARLSAIGIVFEAKQLTKKKKDFSRFQMPYNLSNPPGEKKEIKVTAEQLAELEGF